MESYKLLSKYCPTKNNWILLLNYLRVVGHGSKIVQKLNSGDQIEPAQLSEPVDLMHIFFNYMTDKQLVALVLTKAGQFVLINNQMEIEEDQAFKDGNKEQEQEEDDADEIIRASIKPLLPKIKGISSILTVISQPSQLTDRRLLSNNMQKIIGIKDWHKKLPVQQNVNSNHLDYASFFGLKTLSPAIYQWVKQSGSVVDFEFQYYLNEHQLSELPDMTDVKTVKFSQNCQIGNFDWLKRFPNVLHLIIDQCQQIDETLFRTICQACPNLESVTIRFCCGINVRIFLELLKLDRLQKVVIDFPNFYCQVSANDALVSKKEWSSAHSFSLHSLFLNSENLTLDVLDYLLKSCSDLRDIYLNDNILKMVAKNIMFNEHDVREDNTINFHSATDFRKGFKASRPLTFKNMFKNYLTAPFSKSMLENIRQRETNTREIQESLGELDKGYQ